MDLTLLKKLKLVLIISFLSLNTSQALAITILCLGDSLTEGYGVKPDEAWPALIEAELKKKYADIKVVNAGISGATTASGPSRIKWHLKNIAKNPIDVVILALGANDALRGLSVDVARKNLLETIDLAQKANIKVVLAGMRAPPNLGSTYIKHFDAMYPSIAKEKDLKLVPFLLKGVAADKKLNQSDGIHPNALGHKVIAKLMVDSLTEFKLFEVEKNKNKK